ncbi:MAG: helix-turn-helix transcriptional regulator [Oscillospiraceae bacterium]
MISKADCRLISNMLIKNSPYNLYLLPHKLLKPYISNYTISFPEQGMVSNTLTLIPDASGTLTFAFDGNTISSELWGATTKTATIGSEANDYAMMLFVEFLPCGLYQLTGIDQIELANARLPLQDVNRALQIRICEVLEQAKSIAELVSQLNNIFLSLMVCTEWVGIAQGAIGKIIDSNGLITVKEFSASLYYSERHVNRIFSECVGMNVKAFSRLVRINNAIRLLQRPQTSLMRVALESGFYDQAHFTNDFKAICNVTPDCYTKNMSDFYNETLKL